MRWNELDVLRGTAAILMIVNHVGTGTLADNQLSGGVTGTLVFIGSFAPVLFFFATGVGYGIHAETASKYNHWFVILNKVIILVLADQIAQWALGNWFALNFLSFIAFSSVVLELVRRSRKPLLWASVGFVFVTLMRFVVGSVLHKAGVDSIGSGVVGGIFGTLQVPGVIYPPAPWLAYPFAGYVIGALVSRHRLLFERHRAQVVVGTLVLTPIFVVASRMLEDYGSPLFRWGTVGFAFYVASFAVLLAGISVSLLLCSHPRFRLGQQALSLRGVASLAVVPLHYFLIYLLVLFGANNESEVAYIVFVLIVLATSFGWSRYIETLNQMMRQVNAPRLFMLGMFLIFSVAACLVLLARTEDNTLTMVARTVGQLALCLVFGLPARRAAASLTSERLDAVSP